MQAIENLISAGAKGFLITPNDSKAIVPSIDKARQAGMLVIALDTPTDPPDAADATFATDNFQAGALIGAVGQGEVRAEASRREDRDARPERQPGLRRRRPRPGLPAGLRDRRRGPGPIGDETDPRIVGHDVTDGDEDGGRTAMENLLQKDPTINLVYTINEPAAAGAYQALKAAGKDKAASPSSRSTAAAPASTTSRPASSAPPRSSTR